MAPALQPDPDKIADFCRRYHIRKLALFGSVLRDDFRPGSDVDVLADFHTGHIPDFIALYDIEEELSRIFGGHRVDLVRPKYLNRRIRDTVLAEAEVQYAER